MYCPNCGKTSEGEQNFCRSCGLSLEKVAQSLAEQIPAVDLETSQALRRRRVERWLSILLGSGFAVFVVAVLWVLIYNIIIVKGNVLQGLVFLGLFVAAVLSLLLVVYRESLLEAARKPQQSGREVPKTGNTVELLPESHAEPIPSVTERTTELLWADKKINPKEH